jgi:hypothetical protein
MNKILLVLAMGFALMNTVAASAQTTLMKIHIPFKFTAGQTTLPAGDYDIQAIGNGEKVLSIRNENSRVANLVMSFSCEHLNPSSGTKLIFHRDGDNYLLSEAWVQGSKLGHKVPPPSRENEYARDFPKDEVILAARR